MRDIRELGLHHLRGKVVLVRVDFNVEHASDALRLERSLPTLHYLQRHGAITLIVSHRGRPGGQPVPELSMHFALHFLRERLAAKTSFVKEFDWVALKRKLSEAEPGAVVLLENIRFLAGEEAERLSVREGLARELASCADFFVQDAFAVCHRSGASITEVARLLPSYAGLLVAGEIMHLNRALRHGHQPLTLILAGGKARDKFELMRHLYPHARHILVGGILANTMLKAAGNPMHASSIDEEILHEVRRYSTDSKVVLPKDFIKNTHGKVLDIGPETIRAFSAIIGASRTILWNGPLGFFEDSRYRAGTRGIARAVAHSKAFSIVGGGETTQFLLEERMDTAFSFLSTGGGAMLAYLAGKKLPGIEVLQ